MSTPAPPSLRSQLCTLLALLALLGLTIGLALLPLGAFNTLLAIAISLAKMLLVMLVFMRLRQSHPFVRLAAAAGFVWLLMLIGFALADYLTRLPLAAPW